MERILKLGILVAVILAVWWAFQTLTGKSVMVDKAKKDCTLRRRQRLDGQHWQTSGVDGPHNVLMNAYAPPLAPINPIGR